MTIDTKDQRAESLIEIGISLSSELHLNTLLEKILRYAMMLTHADGGTIYTVTKDRSLHFEIVCTDSLNIHLGGTSKNPASFPDLPLYQEDGRPYTKWAVAVAANRKKTLSIPDVYKATDYDFTGAREFDQKMGYKTISILAIPIKDRDGNIIAVFQLINSIDPKTGQVVPFSSEDRKLGEALASQAGVALTNQNLIDSLAKLFDSFIEVIAGAIDEKSPSTGNHGKRVPIVAQMIAQAVNETDEGPYKDIFFTEDQLKELKIAAYLHDCGKITTPIYLEEKKTKLEGVYDKIDEIDLRIELLRKEAELKLLREKIQWFESQIKAPSFSKQEAEYQQTINELNYAEELITRCNQKEAVINDQTKGDIERIGSIPFRNTTLLSDKEKESLSIERGNLTAAERKILQNHVLVTQRMLNKLNYPKHLKSVPEIAIYHHERMDGKGYPFGKKGSEMPVRARILAIADVFEALSAPDRSYKEPYPISKVIEMMKKMVEEGHFDPILFDIFVKKKVYRTYGERYLQPNQLDL